MVKLNQDWGEITQAIWNSCPRELVLKVTLRIGTEEAIKISLVKHIYMALNNFIGLFHPSIFGPIYFVGTSVFTLQA